MSSLQSFWMLGAVVVGFVSAAGLVIVEHFRQERRRHAMALEFNRLNQQISGLQGQLAVLKKGRGGPGGSIDGKPKRRHRARERTNSNITSTTTDDYNSALDSSDMEFYDVSDEETSKTSTITPLDEELRDIDIKLDDPAQVRTARTELENLLFDYPSSTEILWRIAKAHQRIALEIPDADAKLICLNAGLEKCRQALELNPRCGHVHKWYALCLGSRNSLMGITDKLRDSFDFKRHIDIAIELLPGDATCCYLLGRYLLEIASLSWFERKTVAAIFDKLPECTHQEALEWLLRADSLSGSDNDWKVNKLSVAKCYIGMREYKKALEWLDQAHAIKKISVDQPGVEAEIAQLLRKYGGYR